MSLPCSTSKYQQQLSTKIINNEEVGMLMQTYINKNCSSSTNIQGVSLQSFIETVLLWKSCRVHPIYYRYWYYYYNSYFSFLMIFIIKGCQNRGAKFLEYSKTQGCINQSVLKYKVSLSPNVRLGNFQRNEYTSVVYWSIDVINCVPCMSARLWYMQVSLKKSTEPSTSKILHSCCGASGCYKGLGKGFKL